MISSRSQRGFTLIELLVVLALIGISAAAVQLSLPEPGARALLKEGNRLAALLDVARAHSRSTNTPIMWRSTTLGFEFVGDVSATFPTDWLEVGIQTDARVGVLLGPEALIPAQSIELRISGNPRAQVVVLTDGLGPFRARLQQD